MRISSHVEKTFANKLYWRDGLALSLTYFILAKLGLSFTTVAENVTLIWPPTGLALFGLLVFGARFWPWIYLGAFIVNVSTDVSIGACIGIALGNTLEAVCGAALLRRSNFDNHLSRVRDILVLVIFAAGLSTMVSATMGAATLVVFDIIPENAFAIAWVTWWMGDSMGALVFAPLLLSWWYKERVSLTRGSHLEAVLLPVSVIIVAQFVFGSQMLLWGRQLPLAFITFPFLTWAALRYGMRGASTIVILISAVLLANIIFRQGPFSQGSIFESLTLLWLYTNFIAITSLVLAAAITERHIAEMGMRHLAQHDHLTGLPNRIALQDRIEHAITLAQRHNASFAILFLDIDRFKVINDSLGHAIGDAMLKEIGQRLLQCVRKEDTVSRLGGDEFVILIEEVSRMDDIYIVTKKIFDTVRMPIHVKGNELHTSTSIGICTYPHDGKDVDTLLKHADIAMYRAKDIGRNTYSFYAADMNIQAEKRLSLENDLHSAFQNNEFTLFYQPQYAVADGCIHSAEALLRWQKSDGSQIGPSEFIPVLEETGQILQVGAWVIEQACQQLSIWRSAGMADFRVAVNLSSYQLNDPSLATFIADTLKRYQLPPECLELEITESMLVRQEKSVEDNCSKLVALGIRMAVDDFGTGYSSLSYLHRLSIDTLKIDRSFIEKIPGNADSEAIARAIIGLGKSLKLTLIAEGVENDQQCAFVCELGCDAVQGFLFSTPLPVQDFEVLLSNVETQNRFKLESCCKK